jgi:MFS family permease
MLSLSSFGSSVVSPATGQLMEEFGVTLTQAIVPLTTYVVALGLGPVVGGPLSETVGRYPVFAIATPIGLAFTLATGFCTNFAGVCILRFLSAFALAPSLAVSSGVINDAFRPHERGLPSVVFILMPFLGPGMGTFS